MSKTVEDFIQCRPVDDVTIRREVQQLQEDNLRLRTLTSTHAQNEGRWAGQIREQITIETTCYHCYEPLTFTHHRRVPWATIRKIFKRLHTLTKTKPL